MDNIILNTIKVSTKHLSLRNTLKLRLVCKKLKDKISQEFIVDFIKQRYAKYLTSGDKLCIDMGDIADNTDDNIEYAHFLHFNKIVTDRYWLYKIGDDLVKEYTNTILIPDKIYPQHKFSLHNKSIQYYLDIPSNKIVSLDSQIRKHVGVSKFQEVVNFGVDIINPTRDVYNFYGIYNLQTVYGIRQLFWSSTIPAVTLFVYVIFSSETN